MKSEAEKQALAERLWLGYFNQTLFERGHITEQARNKLALLIERRKPPTAR